MKIATNLNICVLLLFSERICEDLHVNQSTNGVISGNVYLDTVEITCTTGFETSSKGPAFIVQCNADKTWNSTSCFRKCRFLRTRKFNISSIANYKFSK